MQIQFRLGWVKKGAAGANSFKSENTHRLLQDYVARISKFAPCALNGLTSLILTKEPGTQIWICHRGEGAKQFSSEEIAKRLQTALNSGTRHLHIMLGGANGFSKSELKELNPDLLWSFGPQTLPHELATVIAAEQVYRAFTILNKLPYHLGH